MPPDPSPATTDAARASAGERHVDVLVVGAGPAGAAAAVSLRRGGLAVTVVDRARFPRDKCCGDGLTTLALRELEGLGLRPAEVANWQPVAGAWLRSPSGREVEVPLRGAGTFAATAPRRELDAALLGVARTAGAEVLDGHGLCGLRAGDDAVRAEVEGLGTVVARHVVAADGMWSPTRRLMGAGEPGYLGEWHAVRQYAAGVGGPAAERLYVWFEPDLLPGYAWSFPLPGGRANVGYGVLRSDARHGRDLHALWPALLERPHIAGALGAGATLEGRHTAWPIPAGIDRAVLSKGRVLFVGDAARATDVMTGEGIGQALLTGRLAAEAILAARPAGADAVARLYEQHVRGHLLADHRMSMVLSRMLARPLGARGAVRLAGATGWTRRNFARWMFEDEPRAVAFTPRRWHRGFLRRPGAYSS